MNPSTRDVPGEYYEYSGSLAGDVLVNHITWPAAFSNHFTCGPNLVGDKVHPLPQNFRKEVKRYLNGQGSSLRVFEGQVLTDHSFGYLSPPPSDLSEVWMNEDANLYSQLESDCMDRIYEQVKGSYNAAQDFAERSETMELLRSVAQVGNVLREAYSDIRHMRVQKILKTAANGWLTYRYGIMPVVYSTYDALDTLGKSFTKPSYPVKGRRSSSQNGVTYTSSDVQTNWYVTSRVEIGIWMQRSSHASIYDWTTLNPASIAWELLPLSFVADWFVNVGVVLSQWENYLLFADSFLYGYVTHSFKATSVSVQQSDTSRPLEYNSSGTPVDGSYGGFSSWKGGTTVTQKRRSVLTALPAPASLAFKVNLNAKRYTDAVALLPSFCGMISNFLSGKIKSTGLPPIRF